MGIEPKEDCRILRTNFDIQKLTPTFFAIVLLYNILTTYTIRLHLKIFSCLAYNVPKYPEPRTFVETTIDL